MEKDFHTITASEHKILFILWNSKGGEGKPLWDLKAGNPSQGGLQVDGRVLDSKLGQQQVLQTEARADDGKKGGAHVTDCCCCSPPLLDLRSYEAAVELNA